MGTTVPPGSPLHFCLLAHSFSPLSLCTQCTFICSQCSQNLDCSGSLLLPVKYLLLLQDSPQVFEEPFGRLCPPSFFFFLAPHSLVTFSQSLSQLLHLVAYEFDSPYYAWSFLRAGTVFHAFFYPQFLGTEGTTLIRITIFSSLLLLFRLLDFSSCLFLFLFSPFYFWILKGTFILARES